MNGATFETSISPPHSFVEARSSARQRHHDRSLTCSALPAIVQEKKKKRTQTILTSEAAIQIFKLRPVLKTPIKDSENRLKTSSIAQRFGVSPKTVRDIWVGRTWYRQTFSLDPERQNSLERLSKQMGRPKGSKDKLPRSRQRRSQDGEQEIRPRSLPDIPNPAVRTSASTIQWREFSTIDVAVASLYPADDVSMGSAPLSADFALARGLARISDAHDTGDADGFAERFDPFHNDWAYWPKPAAEP
jgi:hypothetical protein